MGDALEDLKVDLGGVGEPPRELDIITGRGNYQRNSLTDKTSYHLFLERAHTEKQDIEKSKRTEFYNKKTIEFISKGGRLVNTDEDGNVTKVYDIQDTRRSLANSIRLVLSEDQQEARRVAIRQKWEAMPPEKKEARLEAKRKAQEKYRAEKKQKKTDDGDAGLFNDNSVNATTEDITPFPPSSITRKAYQQPSSLSVLPEEDEMDMDMFKDKDLGLLIDEFLERYPEERTPPSAQEQLAGQVPESQQKEPPTKKRRREDSSFYSPSPSHGGRF